MADNLLAHSLGRLIERRETLTRAEARALLDAILSEATGSGADPHQAELRTAAILGALAARGETLEELSGFVEALRARATPIPLTAREQALLVDTCGTGGDGANTFNISTAAALVAAAAGVWVAKHGNRAVTSACGSADVLEALGVPVDLSPQRAAESLRRHNFAFLPAPALQPAMRAVLPVRKALGVRTAFNILGPMSNPAGAAAQVLGVYSPDLVRIVAETLARLDTRHAFVVHGCGLDEFALSGPTTVAEVRGTHVTLSAVTPRDFGLASAPLEALAGGNAQQNAFLLRRIFAGAPGPHRDVVVMNAAAVLVVAGQANDFAAGASLAAATIESGKVAALVTQLSTQE